MMVYAVFEYDRNTLESHKTLAKLFIHRESAERWAAIREDESYVDFHSGRESKLHSYVVMLWELHGE